MRHQPLVRRTVLALAACAITACGNDESPAPASAPGDAVADAAAEPADDAASDVNPAADAATDADTEAADVQDVDAAVDPPKEPPLPPGVEVPSGEPLFGVDRITPDVPGVLHGAPAGATLHVWLASPGGQRSIAFEPAPGAPEVELAAAAWILSPAGAFDATGAALVCWNRLSGPESAPGAMPHPSQGLPLVCRALQGGTPGAELTVSADAPSWLSDVALEQGKLVVRYFKNQDGWLVGKPKPGDGLYTRTFDGQGFGPPVLLASALPPGETP